jgi:hypothetical protein
MTSLPKQILEASTPQLMFMSLMGPEFIFMTSKYIEIYIEVMKSGHITSFEQLIEETIEKLEEVEENHPFFD